MILTPRTLLILLALTPYIATSEPGTPNSSAAAPQIPYDSVTSIASRLATIYLDNPAKVIKSRDERMQIAIMALNSTIGEITGELLNNHDLATLVHNFLRPYGTRVNQLVDKMVKIAIESHAYNFLKVLQTRRVWHSPELFHWFQAFIYKSEWYDPELWQTHPVDWSKNLTAIYMADNPLLLEDILTKKLPLPLNENIIFARTAEQVSSSIQQSSRLATWLENLVKSEQMEILISLLKSKALDNLHLEGYPIPKKLPSDIAKFEFFWVQGYRYLPVYHFLSMACEHGRVDILEFLYQLNPKILVPTLYLDSAAKNGHLNVLKWALAHNVDLSCANIGENLILHGYFKIYEQLQNKLGLSDSEKNNVANAAAKEGRLNVVKWVGENFNVFPCTDSLGNASDEMLEWVKSNNPQAINKDLVKCASLNVLKWLLENNIYSLADVKEEHNIYPEDAKQLQCMVSLDLKVRLDLLRAARKGRKEILEFGYKYAQMEPTKEHALSAAEGGHTEALKIIYAVDPLCISVDALLKAVQYGHLGTVEYLESVLKLKDTQLKCDLHNAFSNGNLELIKWVYEHYGLEKLEDSLLIRAIRCAHLDIVNWTIEKQLFLKTDDNRYHFLAEAAQRGQITMFRRLVDYGLAIPEKSGYLVQFAFRNGSLELTKFFVEKNPENAIILKHETLNISNHHIGLWLQDQSITKDQSLKR